MNPKYQDYIDNFKEMLPVNGKCREWVDFVYRQFPGELKKVRGHVILASGLRRPHWWLTSQNGKEILDPTVEQFSDPNYIYGTDKVLFYDPWEEGSPEPIGKCMNCGALCYENANWCSDNCEIELDSYYSNYQVGAL